MNTTIRYTFYDSPIGRILLSGTEKALAGLWIVGEKHAPEIEPSWVEDGAPFEEARRQLDEYFAGERREFDLQLTAEGTAFQKQVWEALRGIPFGVTRSYGQLATQIGNPKAMRAVGLANGQNPISIIVPCHRVIGAGGSLTGYGGGLKAKRWLLDHEQGRGPELFPENPPEPA